MIPTRAIVYGFALALVAGRAANLALSSSPAVNTRAAGLCVPLSGGPVAEAAGLLSVGDAAWKDTREVREQAHMKFRDWSQSKTAEAEDLEAQPVCSGYSSPAITDRLLSALISVESGGNPSAIGDNGRAVGILQIWPVMVDDCNRIAPGERFTLADRLDPERSVRMFEVFVGHYCKGDTEEQIARKWNGGPHGDTKTSTLPYWRRVQAAMGGER